MRRVKIGIIGCGVISHTYLSNIKAFFPWLEIAACADIYTDKARGVAEKYSIARACTVDELLEDESIEIIINLTIPATHAQINQKALLSGKHVYCEKPLALSVEDARSTVELAKSKNLMLGCAPETFLGAALQTCRRIIDEGWIGKPISATANMISHGPETWHSSPEFFYKKGSGPMLDMGPYYLTALVSLLGPVRRTACFASIGSKKRTIHSNPLKGKEMDVEVPTSYTGILQFDSGVHANINMTFDVWLSNLPKLEIYGTEGSLFVPDPNMCAGQIKIFRKEKVLDQLNSKNYNEENAKTYSTDFGSLQEMPQLYQQPLDYFRGLGVLDMAFALVNGRRHRANEELAYHVTEALLSFDTAAGNGGVYHMESTCQRPEPLPIGLDFGELD